MTVFRPHAAPIAAAAKAVAERRAVVVPSPRSYDAEAIHVAVDAIAASLRGDEGRAVQIAAAWAAPPERLPELVAAFSRVAAAAVDFATDLLQDDGDRVDALALLRSIEDVLLRAG